MHLTLGLGLELNLFESCHLEPELDVEVLDVQGPTVRLRITEKQRGDDTRLQDVLANDLFKLIGTRAFGEDERGERIPTSTLGRIIGDEQALFTPAASQLFTHYFRLAEAEVQSDEGVGRTLVVVVEARDPRYVEHLLRGARYEL